MVGPTENPVLRFVSSSSGLIYSYGGQICQTNVMQQSYSKNEEWCIFGGKKSRPL